MSPLRVSRLLFAALALGPVFGAAGAAPKRKPPQSDLAPIEARREVVGLATNLAKIETPDTLAGTSPPHPFNPPGFWSEAPRPAPDAQTPGPAPKSYGDREILTALAAKVVPKGTFGLGSNSLLSFGKKNLRRGDRLTVNYEGQDYTLELVSFDTINFTLRLNKEEITRPIKPGKNQ
jgi:hypothetical protein